ncbi:nucleotidyltransferase domain-containing protein [Aquibacillus koreensis]|uniref:Nucleotidyltransferase domain-containing protein n=1 Tax=Aquibacillus koreensis TaxID=279446 RepID=A0A9X4AJ29_9BACI|nr:nucleotidyltransferase domain-containing protein [Aquibacillus koreensis]MCT2536320.1 nucleotidyltransferase domain-containing protein [Aquibacillus koreensis]MDC3421329.1 nucleotidyltransferase domain-containing protein [Aquibacillus koreensis]
MRNDFLSILEENTLYRVITGSTAYGLANEHSDIDEKAFVILPIAYQFQLGKEWETETFHNPDIEYHSLKKALFLLSVQNPTMLETLFVPENCIVEQTAFGRKIRENRDIFLSQQCFYTFGGYARDQLVRIKNSLFGLSEEEQNSHLQLKLTNMIDACKDKYDLQQIEMNINEVRVENDHRHIALCNLRANNIDLLQLSPMISELGNTLKSYQKRKQVKKPEEKLYKHAMHLVRLLLTGIEVLKTAELTVYRQKDQALLRSIRNQEMSWDELFLLTEKLFVELEQAKEHSPLPKKIDKEKINQLYTNMMVDYFGLQT